MEKQAELSQLQGEHHTKVLEAQKLQRSLGRREQELADLQQAKDQLELELEDLQQQKKKGDKALNVRVWVFIISGLCRWFSVNIFNSSRRNLSVQWCCN